MIKTLTYKIFTTKANIIIVLNFIILMISSGCNSKLTCSKFYTYSSKTVNVKGLSSKLMKAGVSIADVTLGELSIDPKYVVASEELQRLDLVQYTLCAQIKGLPKKDTLRRDIIKQYTKTLTDMLNIAHKPDSLLSKKVTTLEKAEADRAHKENSLKELMATAPNIDVNLVSSIDNIRFYIDFFNEVPIICNYYITKDTTSELVGGFRMERPKIYPGQVSKDTVSRVDVQGAKFNEKEFARDTTTNIVMHFSYESIYYAQVRDSRLKGKIVKKYKVLASKQTLEETKD